jgi:hypothetical protein
VPHSITVFDPTTPSGQMRAPLSGNLQKKI